MKFKYTFTGIDCPLCAQKIEEELQRTPNVANARLDFLQKKIFIEAPSSIEAKTALNVVKQLEPSLMVEEFSSFDKAENKKPILPMVATFVGIGCYGVAILEEKLKAPFWLYTTLFAVAFVLIGLPILREFFRNLVARDFLDENLLMVIASVGAFAIGESSEAVAVVLFYRIGEFFQEKALQRSRTAITQLMDLRPDVAYKEGNNGEKIAIDPETLSVGDVIVVSPGEQIPLDGEIISGRSELDCSSLTGETLPKSVEKGNEVLSGCINLNGVLRIRVTKPFRESTASRILELTENVTAKKSKKERLMTRFAKIYTPLVVFLSFLTVIIPVFIFQQPLSLWLYRGLIFLVISCPCALVISIPLAYFAAIGRASKRGILLKGSGVLEALEKVSTVVFDKTGTLTQGRLQLNRIRCQEGISPQYLKEAAAVAENFSCHPLALAIKEAVEGISPARFFGVQSEAELLFEEIPGEGLVVSCGERWVAAGNERLMEKRGFFPKKNDEDSTASVVFVATEKGFLGTLIFSDELRQEARRVVKELHGEGVKNLFMLTGDGKEAANFFAQQLGLEGCFSELLPHEKVAALEDLMKGKERKQTLFVGDGINDAPVLARADIGVAMGGLGSDAAIEAADVVLMGDDLSQIPFALRLARRTKVVVIINIILALGIKAAVSVLAILGCSSMGAAVFADVGVALLAVFNSMGLLSFEKRH